jgi:hypothetical protein
MIFTVAHPTISPVLALSPAQQFQAPVDSYFTAQLSA